ncbi:type VI secretion system ATPase TssH [Serratia entomophila]|uniref:Type VI secretion system ATPase TssH n=1 Tax=Serratia entomophila TaxID=42906 RepID=A0ABY5CPI4_9GAMM|nr:type VI secretion system ATPase TssH [Serratia entomophila]USU99272.1 type VI secretion system ATPase TssH [Serratia entomophila]CAI0726320.1 protein disaggregation chaperone [Serratia entomophila]CAI0727535.1 protein disaggregation chaperone [Serratia entomophila]CAI0729041.1 protein disaggregation chaperone [Serratia entomophila]CAI0730192.1 protein disaggregation chaperone [Serratia entomophila]
MSEISRSVLFGKLDSLLFTSLESATAFCKLRGNPYVELAHWLHQLMQSPDGDLQQVIRHFALDEALLARDIVEALDRLPRGASAISDLSEHIDSAVERAWVYGSLKFGAARIRGGHLLLAILKTYSLRHLLKAISAQFDRVNADLLMDQFAAITAQSVENALEPAAENGAEGEPGAPRAGGGVLAQYAQDLTAKARNGEIDPVAGRDEEIRQIVDILMRRRQNNPLLTGEAGVGKTAVVEGLALRIVAGDVPPQLRDVQLYLLDIGMLQAGAGVKGEFEKRLQTVIDEVQSSPTPIILFIDEIHTLIGAGGAQGTGDAANLLKPALARGQLRTLGATTWSEYKKYIEKDPALTRRFQVVQVHEPSEDKALLMLRSTVSPLEQHHRILLLDEAVDAAVRLSHRYIPARQLPDKAVALLDTACARVAVSQHAEPAQVEDCRHRIDALQIELEIARREAKVGIGNPQRPQEIETQLAALQQELEQLTARWQEELALIRQIIDLRAQLHRQEAEPADDETELQPAPSADELRTQLSELQQRLNALQGEAPLIFAAVDANIVAAVVSDWTGIPLGRMVKNEIEAVLQLSDTLNQRVIGQRHALDLIARRVRTARARLDDPNKPVGVFLLAGPSGVGKTETALALAETLYGGEQNVITINMSEFQESHTVSTLKGAPPGYVGYGEGGVLTEAVRRRPYSVVLLDEIEKAHPDVHEIFFQVFDKGWMEDGEGRHIDFRNTIIILTSNVGTDLIAGLCSDPDLMPEPEALSGALREPLLSVFPAALLGRLLVVPYYPLTDATLGNIVRLQLGRVQRRLAENHDIACTFDDAVIEQIVSRCTEVESGGRMVDAILTNTLLPQISHTLLTGSANDQRYRQLHIALQQNEFICQFQA